MHDRHTCQVMYGMLCNFLCVLCPKWQVSMLAVASDGARNMTGQAAGVVTRLQNYMHNNCPLFRIWCRAHQLDLVMEHIMTEVVGYSFFNVMLQFISHLSCQQKLIADMGTTCPCVVNRWLSIYKVTNCFRTYRIDHHLHRLDYGGSILLLCKVLLGNNIQLHTRINVVLI